VRNFGCTRAMKANAEFAAQFLLSLVWSGALMEL
jgi:hypothetical protein